MMAPDLVANQNSLGKQKHTQNELKCIWMIMPFLDKTESSEQPTHESI